VIASLKVWTIEFIAAVPDRNDALIVGSGTPE
jgi:hypothetical protein